jgi:hypothetical protein
MRSKWAASRAASQEETANDSSSGEDQFVIQPRPRRTTRKTRASASRATEEAANQAEGQAVREARESEIIQKVERPLRTDCGYTLRRVDHRHPRRPTNFTMGENQSMINRHENPYEWTSDLHDHMFWNNFQADWYLTVIKDRKNPITQQLYVDWSYMQKKRDPMFQKVITKS